ncbi:MAG TPA: ATP-binding cassette domain-containing protein [Clostridia bacterium]|nr:ATP-binding cassette domain-containing protein [Clostridia bacterium]
METNLIEVQNLEMYFQQKSAKTFSFRKNMLKAVDNVSFQIAKGETFGLVGESGSGKSTVGKCILRNYDLTGGKILFDGTDIGAMKEKKLLPFRRKMQSIFQDPYSSLDPTKTIGAILREPMEIHRMFSKSEQKDRALELVNLVGLKKEDMEKYPAEFSGGQRQRIAIARALTINPEFVLCDEPVSALDVSLQAQIVALLQQMQAKMGLTYLFISHQLHLVQKICSHIGVMYLGNMLEITSADQLFSHPLHPYTQMLMSSILEPDPHINCLDRNIPDMGLHARPRQGCKILQPLPKGEELLP